MGLSTVLNKFNPLFLIENDYFKHSIPEKFNPFSRLTLVDNNLTSLLSFKNYNFQTGALLNTFLENVNFDPFFINGGVSFGVFFLITSLFFKIGIAPFHAWLPEVYYKTPYPVMFLLITVIKLIFLLLLVYFFCNPFFFYFFAWRNYIFICIILCLFIGVLGAIGQKNIKKFFAYSSIVHSGYILLGLVCFNSLGVQSCLLYIFIYMITLGFLFYVLGAFNNKPFDKESLEKSGRISNINDLKRLRGSYPFISFLLTIVLLSMAGLPPFIGFFGKYYVLYAFYSSYHDFMFVGNSLVFSLEFFVFLLSIITSVISSGYYLRLIKVMHFDKSDTNIFSYAFKVNYTNKFKDIIFMFLVTLAFLAFIVLFIFYFRNFVGSISSYSVGLFSTKFLTLWNFDGWLFGKIANLHYILNEDIFNQYRSNFTLSAKKNTYYQLIFTQLGISFEDFFYDVANKSFYGDGSVDNSPSVLGLRNVETINIQLEDGLFLSWTASGLGYVEFEQAFFKNASEDVLAARYKYYVNYYLSPAFSEFYNFYEILKDVLDNSLFSVINKIGKFSGFTEVVDYLAPNPFKNSFKDTNDGTVFLFQESIGPLDATFGRDPLYDSFDGLPKDPNDLYEVQLKEEGYDFGPLFLHPKAHTDVVGDEGHDLTVLYEGSLSRSKEDEFLAFSDVQSLTKYNLLQNAVIQTNYFIKSNNYLNKFHNDTFKSILPFLRYDELLTKTVYSPLENNIKLNQGDNFIQNQQFVSELKKVLWLFNNFSGKTPRLQSVKFMKDIHAEPYQNRYFTLAKLNSKNVKTFILSDNLTIQPLKKVEDYLTPNVSRYFIPEKVNSYIFNNYIGAHFMKYLTFQSYLYEGTRSMRFLMLKFSALNISNETISPVFFNRSSSFINLKSVGLPFCGDNAFVYYVNSFIQDYSLQSYSYLDKLLLPYYFESELGIYYGELNLNMLSNFESFPYNVRKLIMKFCNNFLYGNSSFCITNLKSSLISDSNFINANFKEAVQKPKNILFRKVCNYLDSVLKEYFIYFINILENIGMGFSDFVPYVLSKLKTMKLCVIYILYNLSNVVNLIFVLNEFFSLVFLILYNIFTILFLHDLSKLQLFYDLIGGFFIFVFSFFYTLHEANDFYLNFYNNIAVEDTMALVDYFKLLNEKFGPVFVDYFKLAKFIISPYKITNEMHLSNEHYSFSRDLSGFINTFTKPLIDLELPTTTLPYYPEFLNFAEYYNFDSVMTDQFDATYYPLDNDDETVTAYFAGAKPLNYGIQYMWDEDDLADLSYLFQDSAFPTGLAELPTNPELVNEDFIKNLNLREFSLSSVFGGFTSSWHEGLESGGSSLEDKKTFMLPKFLEKRTFLAFNYYFVKSPMWFPDEFDYGGHNFIGRSTQFFFDDDGDEDAESSYFGAKLIFSGVNQLISDDPSLFIGACAGVHDEDNSFSFVIYPIGDLSNGFLSNEFTVDAEGTSGAGMVLSDAFVDALEPFTGQDQLNLTNSSVTLTNSNGFDSNTDFTEGPYVDEMYGLINRWNPRDLFVNKVHSNFTSMEEGLFDLPSFYGAYGIVLNFQTLVSDYYSDLVFSQAAQPQENPKVHNNFLKKNPVNFSFLIDLVRNDGKIYEFLLFTDYNYSKFPGMISFYNLLNNMSYQSFNFLTYLFSLNLEFVPRGYLQSIFNNEFNIFSILDYFGVLFFNFFENLLENKLKYFSNFLDIFNYYFENIFRQYRIANTIFRYGMLAPLEYPSYYQFKNLSKDTDWTSIYNTADELDLVGLFDYEPADKNLKWQKTFIDEPRFEKTYKLIKHNFYERNGIFKPIIDKLPFIHELIHALPYDITDKPLYTAEDYTFAKYDAYKDIKQRFSSVGRYTNDLNLFASNKHMTYEASTLVPISYERMFFENNFYNYGLNGYLSKITRENAYLLDLDLAYRATERRAKIGGNQQRPLGLDFPFRDLSVYRIFVFLLHYFFNTNSIFGESGLLDQNTLVSSDFFVKALHKLPKMFLHFLNFEDMGSNYLLHSFLKEHQFRFKTSFLLFQDSSVNVLQPMLMFMQLYTSLWDVGDLGSLRPFVWGYSTEPGKENSMELLNSPPKDYKLARFILEESEFWDIYHNTDPYQDYYIDWTVPLGIPKYTKEDGLTIPLRSKLRLGSQPDNKLIFDNSPKGVIYFFRNFVETFSFVECLYSLIYLIFVPFIFFKVFMGLAQAIFYSMLIHKIFLLFLLLLLYVKMIPVEFGDIVTNIYIPAYFNYTILIDLFSLIYDYFYSFFERMFQEDLDRLVNFGDEAFFYTYSNLFFMSQNSQGNYLFDMRFSYRFNKLNFLTDYDPLVLNFLNRNEHLSNIWRTQTSYRKQAEFFLNFFNMLVAFNKFNGLIHPYEDSFTSVPALLDWGYFYTPNGYFDASQSKEHTSSPNSYVLNSESLNAEYFNVEDYISRHLRNRSFHDLMFYTTGNINRTFSILYHTEMYTNYVHKGAMSNYPIFNSLLSTNFGKSLFSTGNLAPLYLNTFKSNITFFFYLFFVISFLLYFRGLFKVYLFTLFFYLFRNNLGVRAFGVFFYTLNIWAFFRFILSLFIEVIFLIILTIMQFILKLFTSRDHLFVTYEDDLTNPTTESGVAGGGGLDDAISNNRFVLYHGPLREMDDVVIEHDLYKLKPSLVENSSDGFYVYSQESPYPMSDSMNVPLKKYKRGGAFFANFSDSRYKSLHFTFMYQHSSMGMDFVQTLPERWDLDEHRPMGLGRSYYYGSDIPVPTFNGIFSKKNTKFNYPFTRNRFFYLSLLNISLRFLRYFISSLRNYQFSYLRNHLFLDHVSLRENFNFKLIVINFWSKFTIVNRLKLKSKKILSKVRAFLRSLGT